jgi:hypothetical protein
VLFEEDNLVNTNHPATRFNLLLNVNIGKRFYSVASRMKGGMALPENERDYFGRTLDLRK